MIYLVTILHVLLAVKSYFCVLMGDSSSDAPILIFARLLTFTIAPISLDRAAFRIRARLQHGLGIIGLQKFHLVQWAVSAL
jgi:hypothetical protein